MNGIARGEALSFLTPPFEAHMRHSMIDARPQDPAYFGFDLKQNLKQCARFGLRVEPREIAGAVAGVRCGLCEHESLLRGSLIHASADLNQA
jgi:hypothetical protein